MYKENENYFKALYPEFFNDYWDDLGLFKESRDAEDLSEYDDILSEYTEEDDLL